MDVVECEIFGGSRYVLPICRRYLETFKTYETKPASAIQERLDSDYASRLSAALTCIRSINKTDALTLGTNFGSLASIMKGSQEQLSACPGIGPTKVAFESFFVCCSNQQAAPSKTLHAMTCSAPFLRPCKQLRLFSEAFSVCTVPISTLAIAHPLLLSWLQVKRLREVFNEPFRKALCTAEASKTQQAAPATSSAAADLAQRAPSAAAAGAPPARASSHPAAGGPPAAAAAPPAALVTGGIASGAPSTAAAAVVGQAAASDAPDSLQPEVGSSADTGGGPPMDMPLLDADLSDDSDWEED